MDYWLCVSVCLSVCFCVLTITTLNLQMLLLLLSCIIVSDRIVNSVCWSHALINGPTSKMPASAGGLCIGQMLRASLSGTSGICWLSNTLNT